MGSKTKDKNLPPPQPVAPQILIEMIVIRKDPTDFVGLPNVHVVFHKDVKSSADLPETARWISIDASLLPGERRRLRDIAEKRGTRVF